METVQQSKAGQYLTFYLNKQLYGVPIAAVREINRLSEITVVPQTPNFVAGVMNLRGKVIPVVNLRLRLQMLEVAHTKETCIIVIETDGGQVGTIVDSVSGVIELAASQIEPAPQVNSQNEKQIMGMGKQENQVIILLDIAGCLSKSGLSEVISQSQNLKTA